MAAPRNGAVQIGERLTVIQCADLGHETGEQIEHAIGLGDE